jgi:signal transduction histidine kinase
MRHQLQLVMMITTFLSTALSIVLGLFMMRRIGTRTKVLVSNTVHLQNREPLAPPLLGIDELAYIDTAFHEAAHKLAELERFKQEMVSVTSHELRAPLTSLLAFNDLAGSGMFGAVTKQGEKLLRRARRCTSDLIALITDLLDSEKMQAGKQLVVPTSTNLSDVVSYAAIQLEDVTADRGIHLQCTELRTTTVRADAERVGQALKAILRDAADHVPTDSTIHIATDATSLRITIPSQQHNASPRTRLCISLSELIAQQHGGKFSMEETESGQVFEFNLPPQ